MPEYAFEVELPDGGSTEYSTSGGNLSPERAVERVYERYPEGQIVRQLYGGSTEGVSFANPNAAGEANPNVAESSNLKLPDEATDDASETDEVGEDEADNVADELYQDLTDNADEAEAEDADLVEIPPIDPAAFSVNDLRSELSDRDLSDAELRGLLKSEQQGSNRKTACEAIEEAMSDG